MARTLFLGLPFFIASSFIASSVLPASARAQTSSPADSPASIPAGVIPALPPTPAPRKESKSDATTISAKQAREADDAYLEGAKQIAHKNLAAAERSFEQAVHLDPNNRDYALALIVARENYVTELVHDAAKARLLGDPARADTLLAQARKIDPDSRVVAQHFDTDASPVTTPAKTGHGPGLFYSSVDPMKFPAQDIASTLSGPVELAPLAGKRNVHLQGDPQSVIRSLYKLYGITVTFDKSVSGGRPLSLDMDNVPFSDAARVLGITANIFAIPLQPKTALIAKDTAENREALMPQVEETIYVPGRTNDEMQELANVARNIFDLKQVTASATGGYMLLRGNEDVLREINATYSDMLDGGPEVLFDVNLYEIDKTATNNIGTTTPTSVGAFDLLSSAQTLITSNQSLINQAVAAGLLSLTGSNGANELTELAFLIAAGVSGSSQFTSLIGTIGTDGGLPLLGLSMATGTTFSAALNSSDVRMLDAVQIRSSNRQAVSFRAGTRYPVVTATYSSGVSSSLASSLSGLNINGTSVSSLLAQLGGGSSVNVPQFQFEDLGITLKMTPQILHSDEVSLALDMKIEALAGTSINSIPILNNRTLTSNITVPSGHTAMLATLVSTDETKSFTGIPGLNDIPGFQGTEQDREKDSTELLITITPHIVRSGRMQVSSRRLATVRTGPGGSGTTSEFSPAMGSGTSGTSATPESSPSPASGTAPQSSSSPAPASGTAPPQ
jgi:Flp pilus assembly secretin CpaC